MVNGVITTHGDYSDNDEHQPGLNSFVRIRYRRYLE